MEILLFAGRGGAPRIQIHEVFFIAGLYLDYADNDVGNDTRESKNHEDCVQRSGKGIAELEEIIGEETDGTPNRINKGKELSTDALLAKKDYHAENSEDNHAENDIKLLDSDEFYTEEIFHLLKLLREAKIHPERNDIAISA